uniref:condensation domain-containing protein n=1 Tax=Frankia gtarii TaxID=2950102 RepID=UPI0021C01821
MNRSNIEEVLPLAPLQEGLLFHAVAGGSDAYTVQLTVDLAGPLDAARLRSAAGALVERHANLRTAFVAGPAGAVGVVLRRVEVPWTEAEPDGSPTGVRALLDAERTPPFDMDEPPLIRFLLVRLGPDTHRLVITVHHILMDGWSVPLVLRDLFALYAGTPLPRLRPYRDYLAWLATRDREESLAAWRGVLDGVTEPTLLAPAAPGPQDGDEAPARPVRIPVALDPAVQERMKDLARKYGVTLSTVIQAAWAITLSGFTGRRDVAFGTTVSGRPPELAGVESMVGLFINTIPVRIVLDPWETVAGLLGRLHQTQAATLDHHHLGLAEVQAVTGLARLFDTLLVVESYPVDDTEIDRVRATIGVRVTGVATEDATHYPITLVADPGEGLALELEHRPELLAPQRAAEVGEALGQVMAAMVADPTVRPVGALAATRTARLADPVGSDAAAGSGVSVLDVWDGLVAGGAEYLAVVCE